MSEKKKIKDNDFNNDALAYIIFKEIKTLGDLINKLLALVSCVGEYSYATIEAMLQQIINEVKVFDDKNNIIMTDLNNTFEIIETNTLPSSELKGELLGVIALLNHQVSAYGENITLSEFLKH